jgi:hypothetical protein
MDQNESHLANNKSKELLINGTDRALSGKH